MAESKFPSEGDNHFKYPIQVESENECSKQPLQIQLDEQRSQDVTENLQGNDYRDIQLDGLRLPLPIKSGKLFRGKGQRANKDHRSPNYSALEQKENPTDVSDPGSGCFQKSDAKANSSQIIGQLSGTTTKMYSCKSSIVAVHYRICLGKTQKPKFIGDGNTVMAYQALQHDSQLHPPVLSFTTENGQENEFDVD